MLAAVAPLAPAAAEALAALGLVLAFVVAWGMRRIWRSTIGWLFVHMADLLDAVVIGAFGRGVKPFAALAGFLRSIDGKVDHALAAAALACERSATYLFTLARDTLSFLVDGLADLAEATEHAIAAGLVSVGSKAVSALSASVHRQIRALQATLARVERVAIPALRAQARALDRLTHDQLRRLGNGIDRLGRDVAHTITHAIAAIGARVGRAERTLRGQTRRLTKVEKATAGVGAAALVGAALARLGLSWVRCRNVKNVGKQVCAMDSDLLSALLADTLLIAGSLSLVELAREVQAITEPATHAVNDFLRDR